MREFWDPELDASPWSEVEAWQSARLAARVADVAERSRFYRRKLTAPAVDSLEALADLPFTTKDEVRQAQAEADPESPFGPHQAVPTAAVNQTLSSSGTTGRPTYYALTAADRERWADGVANMYFTAGVRPEDTFALTTGIAWVAGGLPYADGVREIGANLAWMGGLSTEKMLAALTHLGVTTFVGTASFVSYLVDHEEEAVGRPASALGVRKVIAGGEPGLGQAEIRQHIRSGWGVDHVREVMGLCDVLAGMWAECEEEDGMHFTAARHVLAELVDPGTLGQLRWKEGATGEVVYTTLDRDATPLLRFRSADQVVVTGVGCRCGRGAPRLRVVGRTDDMLIYKAMNVYPTAIRDVVLSTASDLVSPRMRVRKERPDQVRFDHPIPLEVEALDVLPPEDAERVKAAIAQAVRQKLQVRVDVEVLAPGGIPQDAYKNPLVYVGEPGPGS